MLPYEYDERFVSRNIETGKGTILLDCAYMCDWQDYTKLQLFVSDKPDAPLWAMSEIYVKTNHRYPNKKYYTMSGSLNNKVDKGGVSIPADMLKQDFTIGVSDGAYVLLIPLHVEFSKEKPIALIKVHLFNNAYKYNEEDKEPLRGFFVRTYGPEKTYYYGNLAFVDKNKDTEVDISHIQRSDPDTGKAEEICEIDRTIKLESLAMSWFDRYSRKA